MGSGKAYDLEQRTEIFSLAVRDFFRKLKLDVRSLCFTSRQIIGFCCRQLY